MEEQYVTRHEAIISVAPADLFLDCWPCWPTPSRQLRGRGNMLNSSWCSSIRILVRPECISPVTFELENLN